MKQFNLLLLVATIIFGGLGVASAQDAGNKWAISFGANAVDFYPVGGSQDKGVFSSYDTGNLFSQYFNADDHWNMIPAFSRVAVTRYVGDGFSFGLAASFNKLDQVGKTKLERELNYYGVDAEIKYGFGEMLNSTWLDPYLGIGGGATWIDDKAFGTANALAGFNFWITEHLGINLQSAYKHNFEDVRGATHFQHAAGVIFKFGSKDSDGDGIPDHKDKCPFEAGPAEFDGCPDSDGDGIPDHLDECPDVAGPAENNGCPWPDSDGDGIPDHLDNCPNEAGPAENNGCPWPDTDGDGIPDHLDKCPEEAGPASNDGCPEPEPEPEPTEEVIKQLNEYSRAIFFDTGKSTVKAESRQTLQNIASKMKEYLNSNFIVSGHTDSTGSKALNQRLSEERAASVVDYLVDLGISEDRLTSEGFGPDKPIADNKTAAGREKNRRVEISLKK